MQGCDNWSPELRQPSRSKIRIQVVDMDKIRLKVRNLVERRIKIESRCNERCGANPIERPARFVISSSKDFKNLSASLAQGFGLLHYSDVLTTWLIGSIEAVHHSNALALKHS